LSNIKYVEILYNKVKARCNYYRTKLKLDVTTIYWYCNNLENLSSE